MQTLTFQPGEIIFREGEDSDFAYIVQSGTVDIFKRFPKGTVLLAQLGQGETFGEMGILSDAPRSASAAASSAVTVTQIGRNHLDPMLAQLSPELQALIQAIMERLRETNQKISRLVDKQAQFQLDQPGGAQEVNRVTLTPLSAELKDQMRASIITLPFRVGGTAGEEEASPLDYNNLVLKNIDSNIMARNHFAIQRNAAGLYVIDRGSKTGTIVNDLPIGGETSAYKADLKPGDNTIIAGREDSLYRFCVTWE